MPIRTCIGCRQRAEQSELIRAVAVDGVAVIDERRRLPGRGAWLHRCRPCVDEAIRRRALRRALRAEVANDALDSAATGWSSSPPTR